MESERDKKRKGGDKPMARAILSCIFTIGIAIIGVSGYNSGSRYMTWFGIPLSQQGFGILICLFIFFDIRAIMGALKAEENAKKMAEQSEKESKKAFKKVGLAIAEARKRAEKAEQFDGEPCVISLARLSIPGKNIPDVVVFLNGRKQGVLENGGTLSMRTTNVQNELTAWLKADDSIRTCNFTASPSGNISLLLQHAGFSTNNHGATRKI